MKKRQIFIQSLFVLSLLCVSSCKDFEELQIDPNRAVEAQPSLLLTGIEVAAFNRVSLTPAVASRYAVFTDGTDPVQYYGWQRSGFEQYDNIRQVTKMEEEAKRLGRENYVALAKFFRSYFFIDLTQRFGDIPYEEAMQGTSNNFTPQYTPQEDIYADVLKQLTEASDMLTSSKGEISGDVIYGGDIIQWKKLINSFKLRVLMSLSAKEGNARLNIKEQFRQIVENPTGYPIISSNKDNAALPYFDRDGNRYPYFNNNSIKTAYYLDESFVNLLKERQDPRLFSFAAPEFKAAEADLDTRDFNAYGGLQGDASLAENTVRLNAGEGSPFDARFYNEPVNEPSLVLSYAEVEFILAEAIQRGWISGDAALHYRNGIRASMQYYGIADSVIDRYLAEPKVMYDPAAGIEMISTQKYLASFMNSGWEPFYNQRRTGFPTFSATGEGIINKGQVPKRWMYPESELNLNRENVQEAINRQFPQGDDINGVMWLLKQE
jgi:hypothetical protein